MIKSADFRNVTARECVANAILFLDCASRAKEYGMTEEVREYVQLARRVWRAALVLEGRLPFVHPFHG